MRFSFWINFALFANLANFAYGAAEYELLTIEVTETDANYIEQNITTKRVSRGTHTADISTTIVVDLPTNTELEILLLRSAPGSNQFIPSPIKMPKVKLEKFMNQYYKKYVMEDITKHSNFPAFEGEYEGPFPKGYYWIKDYRFNTDNIKGVNLPAGLYKAVLSVYVNGKLIYRLEVMFRWLVKN